MRNAKIWVVFQKDTRMHRHTHIPKCSTKKKYHQIWITFNYKSDIFLWYSKLTSVVRVAKVRFKREKKIILQQSHRKRGKIIKMKFKTKNNNDAQLNAMQIWVMFTVLMERFIFEPVILAFGFVRFLPVIFFFIYIDVNGAHWVLECLF